MRKTQYEWPLLRRHEHEELNKVVNIRNGKLTKKEWQDRFPKDPYPGGDAS